jgi:hypothetical protein
MLIQRHGKLDGLEQTRGSFLTVILILGEGNLREWKLVHGSDYIFRIYRDSYIYKILARIRVMEAVVFAIIFMGRRRSRVRVVEFPNNGRQLV